jgi:dipeptidyl aminopeptidase/acylaminoacyl peptidase
MVHPLTNIDVRPLKNGKLFITATNFIDNSLFYTLDSSRTFVPPTIVSSNSKLGSAFGLSEKQIGEIRFRGANQDVHAWVIKPSNFTEGVKYPLAYLIHGGPQGAWSNSWSTRWNPAVFAEQGYVVVCPNPTGSTGYGQEFCDAIKNQWGGFPYEDLVCGFNYIESSVEYIDTTRAVALGASYGGQVSPAVGESLLTFEDTWSTGYKAMTWAANSRH